MSNHPQWLHSSLTPGGVQEYDRVQLFEGHLEEMGEGIAIGMMLSGEWIIYWTGLNCIGWVFPHNLNIKIREKTKQEDDLIRRTIAWLESSEKDSKELINLLKDYASLICKDKTYPTTIIPENMNNEERKHSG